MLCNILTPCRKLARAITEDRHLSDVQLVLVDVIQPKAPPNLNAVTIQADLTDPAQANALFDSKYGEYDAVYCMHGIMSRGSEDNFDLGIKVIHLLPMTIPSRETDILCPR